jgi:hypothetical protein
MRHYSSSYSALKSSMVAEPLAGADASLLSDSERKHQDSRRSSDDMYRTPFAVRSSGVVNGQ